MRLCSQMSPRNLTIAGVHSSAFWAWAVELSRRRISRRASPSSRRSGGGGRTAFPTTTKLDRELLADRGQGSSVAPASRSFSRRTRQRVLSVAVRMPADTKKPVFLMQLPLGVYLPAGATLQIGKEEAKTLPFTSCDQGGCIAEYAVTDAELAAIAKGADLTISAQGSASRKPFTLTVPSRSASPRPTRRSSSSRNRSPPREDQDAGRFSIGDVPCVLLAKLCGRTLIAGCSP